MSALILMLAPAVPIAAAPGPPTILSVAYVDIDGDRDTHPDTGETGRLRIRLRNGDLPLTEVRLVLTSRDPDLDCILEGVVTMPLLAAGEEFTVGTLEDSGTHLSFKASESLETVDAGDPARIEFCLEIGAAELGGTLQSACAALPADLDDIAGAPAYVAGPDGLRGTADDGILLEGFDVDRDGIGGVDLSDGRAGVPNDTLGHTAGTAAGGLDQLGGIGCAGFLVPPDDPSCRIDPDNDMSWHIHCPPGECPAAHVVGSETTYQATPAGGALAFSGRNSLHWGRHRRSTDRLRDTTAFRELAAFITRPIDLTATPRTDDLILSFMHIVDTMDHNALNVPAGQAVDYGDLQVRVGLGSDPDTDVWGVWDKLAPFENVYDHVPYIWSTFGVSPTYCNLTPTDSGSEPYAPRGVRETLCYPSGVWSHCGNAWGTDHTYQCPGPGRPGSIAPESGALWVRTRASLSAFAGRRIQVRWIAQGWEFLNFGTEDDYVDWNPDWGAGLDSSIHDDGWWIDEIVISGAVEEAGPPTADQDPPPGGTCAGATCVDFDGDGFGPPGYAGCSGGDDPDCDDLAGDIHPGAPEICDGLDNDCNDLADDGPGGLDPDGDGVATACDNCPADPNPDQDLEVCKVEVVDVAIDFSSPLGRGSGTITWTAPGETDMVGYNIIVLNQRGERVQINDFLIPCEACLTGEPVFYAYYVPKHRSGRDLYVEAVQRTETTTYGPAVRR